MKKLSFLFAFFMLIAAFTKAEQKVILVESYDKEDGTPSGINKNWDIDKDKGGYVYILYSQDRYITEELSLYIDKKSSSGSYVAFDTQFFTYDESSPKKKFAVYDYKFTEEGDYRISIMGKNSNELASTYTNIGFQDETGSTSDNEANKKKSGKSDKPDTYYYEDSKVTFGESIDANAIVTGESKVFYMTGAKRDIMAKVQQDTDLKCTEIKVYVYTGDDYKDRVSNDIYTIESLTWSWIKFPITADKPGKYVVDIYNQDDTFINSGYFEVKR